MKNCLSFIKKTDNGGNGDEILFGRKNFVLLSNQMRKHPFNTLWKSIPNRINLYFTKTNFLFQNAGLTE